MHPDDIKPTMKTHPYSNLSDYKLLRKLASGAFGEVHEAIHTPTNHIFAIKIEKHTENKQLKHEYLMYKKLQKSFTPWLSKIFAFGQIFNNNFFLNAMVMEKLGNSLEQYFVICRKQFSLKTTLMLGEMVLNRIEFLHCKGIIHRDVKPDNFVFGLRENYKHHLYVLDLGLAKEFRNSKNYTHIPFKTGKSLVGTARYCSLNTHLGIEQSRRDDLEAVGYCLIYFYKGKLPWQGLQAKNKAEKYEKIKQMKYTTTLHELCEGMPEEFINFMNYVRHLNFDENPDYCYLRKLLKTMMQKNDYRCDYQFDWFVQNKLN